MRNLYASARYCKLLFLTTLIVALSGTSYGQTNIANYQFAVSSGSYTPISGGTVLWTSWDSETSAALPLGGTFTYGGTAFTTCYVSANGAITFGASSSSSTILSTLGSTTGAVAAWVNDGASSTAAGATPSISYMNIGGATGEFVVQFADHARYANRSTERLNFQIRLNLATNEIKVVYGSFTPSGSTATSSQVGIRGNSTTYASNVNNLMLANVPAGTNCNWSNPVTGASNSSTMLYTSANNAMSITPGLTYTWTPQSTVAPVRTFSAVSAITSSGATISWTAPTGATQYNVQYRIPGSCTWTNFTGNPVSGTTATLTGLIPATSYQVRVQSSNGTNNAIWSHIPNTAGTGDGYTATGTFTTAGLPTDLQALQLQTPAVNATGCYLANATVTIRIKNAGTTTIDFTTNNATISASVSGANATTFTPVVLSSGTLAAGATQDVVVSSNYNMAAAGTYTFNATAILATPDANTSNDAIAPTDRTSTSAATLPQLVNFTGYAGTPASLNTAFPGWTEGSGAVTPVIGGDGSFLATSSTAHLNLYGAAAKMNLYSTNVGWLISPKFVPTANHQFKYKAALTDYNAATAANFGPNDTVRAMISTDCGVTWITLREFTAASNNGLDNSTNALRLFSEPLTAYAGQQVIVAIYARRTPTGTTPDIDIVIDDLAIDIPTVCYEPTSVQIPTFGTTGAEVAWTAPTTGSPVDYQIYYSTSSTPPTASATPNITGASSPTMLTGLTPNTTYHVWVRSNCGGADVSMWSNVASFTTLCDPVSVPWSEGFESLTTVGAGVMGATCMTTELVTGTNWTTANTAVRNSLGARTGTNYIWSRWSSDAWLYSPGLTLTAGVSYDFSFYYRLTDATSGFTINATVGDNPVAASMTTSLGTLTNPVNTTYQQAKYSFTPSATGVYYFGIHSEAPTSTPWYFEVDDISVSITPSCDVPTAISVPAGSITATGANIEWAPPATGSPVSYDIYYVTTNTAPTASSTPNVTGANSPATLTGLSPNTTYYIWMRTFCGGTDVSSWTAGGSFTTSCNPLTTFPWTENFEGVTPPAMPSCFTVINNNNDGDKWITYTTYGVGGSNAAGLYTDFNAGANDDYLVLPPMTLTGNQRFRFSVRARSATEPNDYKVVLSTTGTNPTDFSIDLKPLTTVSSTTHTNIDWIDLSGYTGTVYLAVYVPGGGLDGYYLYIDDMIVENIPTCDAPSGITVSAPTNAGAQVDWVPPVTGSPVSYQIYYSTTNTAPTASSTPNVTSASSPATLTGLTASTTYYIWVRTFCGGTDVSSWASGGSFTTLCNPVSTLPWTENFDALSTVGTTNFPSCWKKENGDWRTADASTDSYTDPRSAPNYLRNTYTATNEFMWTPGFQLTSGTSYDFSFWWMGDGYTGWTGDVFYNTNQASTGATQLGTSFVTTSTTTAQTYAKVTNTFVAPADGVYYFAIRINANGTPWYLGFDDFKLEVSPTCGEPTGIVTSSVTPTGLQVDWTSPAIGSVTDYSWELRSSGAAGSGATGLVSAGTTSTTTANFTTLTPATAYTFYVRTNCVSPDVSTWASKAVFTAPVNDECADAITVYKSTPVNGTTVGSNPTMPADACATTGVADDDVWYKFTASYSGDASIAVTNVSATLDVVIVAYSGTCGAFTSIGCADGPGNGGSETANLTGLNAGETYYFRVWSYAAGEASNGTFTVTLTGSALPVTMNNFRGEQSGSTNKLLWNTATETNNKGFELQRSADGSNFSSLAFIATKGENGNSTSQLSYAFNDLRPIAGNNYYRLKQVDKDGRFTYSNVVLLSRKVSDITLSSVYPNPATRELNVVITSPRSEKVTIIVTDLSGKVLVQQPVQLVVGENKQKLDVMQLSAGTYFIKTVCLNGCESETHRFVKH